MKKLLLALFISASLPSAAQSWATPGATWYYDFQYFSMTGYERIQKIGDTTINGLQYDKLQIYRRWFDQSNQQFGGYYVPQLEFTRADSGTVYFYRDSADYVLYNFNAQPGDTWLLHGDPQFSGGMCDTGSVVVDSVAVMIINGDTLRKLYTSPVNWSGITFFMPVVEKIGGLANLLPTAMCVVDVPQGYNLRCYSDSTGWIYQNPNWNYACDDMMGVGEDAEFESFTVFADAQSQVLTLSGSQITNGAIVQVYDTRGQLLLQEVSCTNGRAEIKLGGIAGGIYYVSVTTKDSRLTQPFVLSR